MKNSSFKPPLFQDLTPGQEQDAAPTPQVKLPGDEVKPETFRLKNLEEENLFAHRDLSKERLQNIKFEAGKFMEEGTLLTNVEEYSKSVREDADLYAKRTKEEAALLKSEIELELAEAKLIQQKAKEEAEAILEEANASRDEVRRQATETGYSEGFDQGKTEHAQANEAMATQIEKLLAELRNLRQSLFHEYESQLVRLTLLLAKKVVHHDLSHYQPLVLDMLQESIKQLENMEKVRIRVHPEEYDFLIQHKESLQAFAEENQSLSFRADPTVPAASVILECDQAQINLTLQEQFQLLEEQLSHNIEERKALFRPPAKETAPPADPSPQPQAS